jgi:hypothetical protein
MRALRNQGLLILLPFFMVIKSFRILKRIPLEAIVWFSGLIVLAFYEPTQNHVSICPLYRLGFDFCPGCGLGRSISFLFHGEIIRSLTTHPLGIFAVIVLSFRIVHLLKHYLKFYGTRY